MTEVTVVVPTRHRPRALERCLEALVRQHGCGSIEIVVADDGTDGAAGVARRAGARIVGTGGVGAAAARNAGAAAARGEFVLFTDDDCVPHPGWAAALVASLRDDADVVGGRTENGVPGNPFVAATETIRAHLEDWARSPGHRAFVASNNLGCRRELALAVPFDESYAAAGGEDRDWCARVAARGGRFARVDDAVLVHQPSAGFTAFWRQHVRYGRGAYKFGRSAGVPRLERPAFYAGLLRRGFEEGVGPGALVLLAQVATAIGYAAEARAAGRESQARRGGSERPNP